MGVNFITYNFRNRVGERYGMQTVIRRAEDGVYPSAKVVRWLCKCDCGNETIVTGSNLKRVHSCGCNMHNRPSEDLSGKRFGLLIAICRVEDNVLPSGQRQIVWQCKCDCGSQVRVRAATLKNGDTKSCGCVKSHGERKVAEQLTKINVSFRKEFSFPDCVNSKGNRLKFDFAIFGQGLLVGQIEYQGKQHYIPPERTPWFGQMQRDETDKIKREYCLTHKIPLFEIRYDEDIEQRISEIKSMLHDNTVPSMVNP